MALVSTAPKSAFTLDFTSFDVTAPAGTVIGTFRGKDIGTALTLRPQDGRFAIKGNDVTGWSLVVGYTASALGTYTISIKEANPQDPTVERVSSFTVTCRKALPALPLPLGAKVMGFGHSMIQRGGFTRYLASQTVSGGVQGHQENVARAALSWVKFLDQRFDISTFPVATSPFSAMAPSTTNAIDGATQALSGETLSFSSTAVPGTLARTAHATSRNPDIVYLHIGENEITTNGYFSAPPIISLIDEQLRLFRNAGVWVVIQTLQTRDPTLWTATQRQIAIDVNTWIAAQAGRDGVKVCDTRSVLSDSVYDAASFGPDKFNVNSIGAQKIASVLLPILQSMVSAGSIFNTDATVSNLFANSGMLGTTGTKSGTTLPVGSVATNWTANISIGVGDTVNCSKEVITAGVMEKQVFSITPNNDGVAVHSLVVTQSNTTPFVFANMGIVDGDWIEAAVFLELSTWNAWLGLNFFNEISNTAGGFTWQGNSGLSTGDTSQVLPNIPITGWCYVRFQIFPGLSLNSFRINSRPFTIQYRSDVGGSGVAKLSQIIYRKIGDPRIAWNNLP